MKKLLCTCVSVVSLVIALLLLIKINVDWFLTERPQLKLQDRISFRKCKEYKKLTASPFFFGDHSGEVDSEEAIYECTRHDPYISGGVEVEDDEYLHMAAIGWINNATGMVEFHCGGSLISEQFVLTAAHCESNKFRPPHFVRLGERNLKVHKFFNNQSDYLIEKFIRHEKFGVFGSPKHDIALIRLQRNVKFSHHHNLPACLFQTEFEENDFVVTGWGQDNKTEKSNILKKVLLKRQKAEVCKRQFGNYSGKHEICANFAREPYDDTCSGDSGGPIQLQDAEACVYHVIGVTSGGLNLCGKRTPSVYTKVPSYIDWIEAHVWPGQ